MNLVVAVGEDKLFLSNPYFYCDIGIVDPGLTLSMPQTITANTGIDALSHAVEGLLHKNSSPFGDVLCLASIEMISANLRKAVADGQDKQARYYMSLAAVLGMMGMMFSGALYAHSAAYAISKYKPVPHGLGCGIPLPYTMAFNLPVCVPKLARMAAAFGEPTWMLSELDAAQLAVDATARLNEDVGLPVTLQELGDVKEEDLDDMADMMIEKWPRPANPRPMGKEESRQFWHDMWTGNF
jgi:alcohol dehydrogenase